MTVKESDIKLTHDTKIFIQTIQSVMSGRGASPVILLNLDQRQQVYSQGAEGWQERDLYEIITKYLESYAPDARRTAILKLGYQAVLHAHRGDVERACQFMGVQKSVFYRNLKKLGLASQYSKIEMPRGELQEDENP